MTTRGLCCTWLLAAMMVLASGRSMAEGIRVAVASNFVDAITAIAVRFEARTDHEVTLSAGSTGKHYAWISPGTGPETRQVGVRPGQECGLAGVTPVLCAAMRKPINACNKAPVTMNMVPVNHECRRQQ